MIALPPVRTEMSSSIILRRSPNPGAFTAQMLIVPRSLLTTSVASASPSTSSDTIRRGLPERDLLEQRKNVFHAADLLFVDQDVGIFEHAFHAVGIGYKVR